jgi:hypothetical protein
VPWDTSRHAHHITPVIRSTVRICALPCRAAHTHRLLEWQAMGVRRSEGSSPVWLVLTSGVPSLLACAGLPVPGFSAMLQDCRPTASLLLYHLCQRVRVTRVRARLATITTPGAKDTEEGVLFYSSFQSYTGSFEAPALQSFDVCVSTVR